jgi:hypothetical protein
MTAPFLILSNPLFSNYPTVWSYKIRDIYCYKVNFKKKIVAELVAVTNPTVKTSCGLSLQECLNSNEILKKVIQ